MHGHATQTERRSGRRTESGRRKLEVITAAPRNLRETAFERPRIETAKFQPTHGGTLKSASVRHAFSFIVHLSAMFHGVSTGLILAAQIRSASRPLAAHLARRERCGTRHWVMRATQASRYYYLLSENQQTHHSAP
jgi:hypothetical protein